MSLESYLNHPTFGLLLLICPLGNGGDIFTTLYAHRLFFLVKESDRGMEFEPLGRDEARSLVDNQMRSLRRAGKMQDYKEVQETYRRTFQ
ncbi:MAG: PipX family protein [Cyanobacteria bacterium P01_D01_bin.73]